MPDPNHTGPAPEEMDFPTTLRITIESTEDAFDKILDAAGAAERNEHGDAVISFASTKGLCRLLTDRRLELLRSLTQEPAESITAIAERLDRSYSVVHEDIDVLAEYGIVQFRRDGQSKQPFVPYETIKFDVTIHAATT